MRRTCWHTLRRCSATSRGLLQALQETSCSSWCNQASSSSSTAASSARTICHLAAQQLGRQEAAAAVEPAGVPAQQASPLRQHSRWDHLRQPRRRYAAAADTDELPEEQRPVGSPKLQKLVDEILGLNLLEAADLTELLKKRLGVEMPMMPLGAAPVAAAPAGAPAAAEEPKAEQTEFDVKLDGFDTAAKIKVIKEVRAAVPELGLKEAKELVEKCPAVLKKGLKKEAAEALKQKLEAAGAKVSLQ